MEYVIAVEADSAKGITQGKVYPVVQKFTRNTDLLAFIKVTNDCGTDQNYFDWRFEPYTEVESLIDLYYGV